MRHIYLSHMEYSPDLALGTREQRSVVTVLHFPQHDREESNEDEAIIRRWLKLADIALSTDEPGEGSAPGVPIPDRRVA